MTELAHDLVPSHVADLLVRNQAAAKQQVKEPVSRPRKAARVSHGAFARSSNGDSGDFGEDGPLPFHHLDSSSPASEEVTPSPRIPAGAECPVSSSISAGFPAGGERSKATIPASVDEEVKEKSVNMRDLLAKLRQARLVAGFDIASTRIHAVPAMKSSAQRRGDEGDARQWESPAAPASVLSSEVFLPRPAGMAGNASSPLQSHATEPAIGATRPRSSPLALWHGSMNVGRGIDGILHSFASNVIADAPTAEGSNTPTEGGKATDEVIAFAHDNVTILFAGDWLLQLLFLEMKIACFLISSSSPSTDVGMPTLDRHCQLHRALEPGATGPGV